MDLKTGFDLQQSQQKWEDCQFLNYDTVMEQPQSSVTRCSLPCNLNNHMKPPDNGAWDLRLMLNNLSFLEQKIHHLQELVQLILGRKSQVLGRPDELVAQQHQLITADLTSVIVQLISTAGSLLPSVNPTGTSVGALFPSVPGFVGAQVSDYPKQVNFSCNTERNCSIEEHEAKDEEDTEEGENLLPGSYEILQLGKEEILAPHTHFCSICGKGFKRDANLRMHMRGHGDEYKTPEALAKPHKESSSEAMIVRRYSCPFAGCKRNKEHKKFQPLKTILCVKNHYKRTHCDKSYICSRCNTKKFSVIADLKTHEKHCGKDKWVCSCGTTFSRKDKLFGHIGLFQGHTPAIAHDEVKASPSSKVESASFNFGSNSNTQSGNGVEGIVDMKGSIDDPACCFSPFNFDTCNFGGFHEFPRPPFDDQESSFSFLMPGSCSYDHKTGGESNSSNLESC